MADVKKIATRESYGNALKELGAEHDDLIVFDADLGRLHQDRRFQEGVPGPPLQLRHRRGEHDGGGRRSGLHGLGGLCLQLCHVRRRDAPSSRSATPSATPI